VDLEEAVVRGWGLHGRAGSPFAHNPAFRRGWWPHYIDLTNNRTEQKIRFVVIDRKVTQGTKGEVGWQWCQRIWTTIATCRQRGVSIYRFLLDAIQAQLHNTPAPSMISA